VGGAVNAGAGVRRSLGNTGIEVTAVCFGTGPLGNVPEQYGREVVTSEAVATVEAVLDSPIRFIDTANCYGQEGAAERRLGEAFRAHGGLPDDIVLATKVDPDPQTKDFSGRRVQESFEESLERLGIDRVPLLYFHDPERSTFEEATASDGPVAALVALKDSGRVGFIGVAGGSDASLRPYLDLGVFDVVLSHNRYTLVDRSAEKLFVDAHDSGIGVVNAAPYGGGFLAKRRQAHGTYGYREADERVARAAVGMQAACDRYDVPLAAAALQFSMRAPFVDSTVVGASAPERVQATLEYAALDIPQALMDELESLVPPQQSWLG